MAADKGSGRATIIIRRDSDGEGDGHHGGAWKVAYADFMTAMMAFFLMMWLLNATTEKQRQGLAEYFNPTVVQRPGASGDGVEEGSRQTLQQIMAENRQPADFDQLVRQIQDGLDQGAEPWQGDILRHVATRVTDEGLVIELGDLAGQSLFVDDTAQPHPVLNELAAILTRVLRNVDNDIALSGHVRAYPEMLVTSPVWALSDARAHTVRNLLERAGFEPMRVQRVSGYADRKPRDSNPMNPENNRIELILLR